MTAIQFVDRVPTSTRKPRSSVVAALQLRPGEWALVYEQRGNSKAAPHVRAGVLRKLGCETEVRARTVYARWPIDEAANETTYKDTETSSGVAGK